MDSDVSMGGDGGRGGRGGRGRGGRGGRGRGQRSGVKEHSLLASKFAQRGRGRGIPQQSKKDNDGDVGMGETQASKAVAVDTRKWRKNKDAFGFRNTSTSCVVVKGFDESQTEITQLGNFLSSKCSTPVNFVNGKIENGKAFITVETSGQATALQKLSGIRYFGAKLLISFTGDTSSDIPLKGNLLSLLLPFVEAHYNRDQKFLSLANLGGTNQDGITFDFNNANFVKHVFTAIGQKCSEVVTISFANDQIRRLEPFAQLPKYIHNTLNLSFDSNPISEFEELDHLKGVKIRELELKNTPLKNVADAKFQSEVSRRFPNLKYLDGQKLQPVIDFGLPSYLTAGTLPPIKGNLYDSPQTQQLVESFLQKFFQVYDTSRNQLIEAYTDQSYFSMSTTLQFPARQTISQDQMIYKTENHNLCTQLDPTKRISLVKQGRIDIVHFLGTLPTTRHHFEDFRVDAYLMKEFGATQVLCINLHGYFWEANLNLNRSYDRTFFLTPVAPNSTAASQGWPATVLNDMLHVRNFVALPSLSTQPQVINPVSSPIGNIVVTSSPVILPNLSGPSTLFQTTPTIPKQDAQPQMIEKMVTVTGMKPEFAKMCLEENQWNFDKAVEAFNSLKARGSIQQNMML